MRFKFRSSLSVSAIAMAAAAPAWAQSASDAGTTPVQASAANQAEPDFTNEIIVTAQKRAERLQDVPRTVDVVQGDTVQKLNLLNFSDIQQLTPGLSLTSTEPSSSAVTLRGVGFDPNSGTSPTVDIYFNETPLDSNSAFRSLYDVGQIEVLRGPQGTLRGRTSPSGAITIGTRHANLQNVDGYFQQTLTTQDGINTQGALSVPLVTDVLAVRVAGLLDRNNGNNAFNIRNGSRDRDDTESARVSVAFKPTSNLSFDLTYQYLNNRTTANPIVFTVPGSTTDPMLTPADRISVTNGQTSYNYRGHLVTLAARYDFGTLALDYIGGYQNIDRSRAADLARGGSVANYQQPQTFATNSEQITQELRLSSQGNRFWNFLIGGYFADNRSSTQVSQRQVLPFGFIAGPALPPLPIAELNIGIDIPNSGQDYAVFTDHRFQVTSKDQLSVGLRYQETVSNRAYNLSLSGPVLGPNPILSSGISPANQHATYRQLTGGASFRHEFSRDLTAYVNYGRAYRPGGVTATTAVIDESLLLFKAEKSDNYEIGLKGALFDRKLQFSIAAYQQDFKNYQAYTGSYLSVATAKDGVADNNVAFTFNADARVRGVEANLSTRLGTAFQLGLSATYNDAKFKNATAPCNDYNGDGVADSVGTPRVPVGQNVAFCRLSGRLSDQAPWGVSVNAEYDLPISGDREIFARGVANYVPPRTDPFQNVRYDGLLNNSVFLGVRGPGGKYEFAVFAKNLANVATLTSRGGQQVDYSIFPTGYSVGTPVRPREFGLNFRASFGK
jgi:iron complex outermembrane receptor protein